jgi:hypothetical protein
MLAVFSPRVIGTNELGLAAALGDSVQRATHTRNERRKVSSWCQETLHRVMASRVQITYFFQAIKQRTVTSNGCSSSIRIFTSFDMPIRAVIIH